ncbi:MAG: VOC family protein [Amaricoccus sp.]
MFEAGHPARLARFWAGLLEGYAIRAYDAEEIERLRGLGFTPETDPAVMVDGPGPSLCFHRVPGRRYSNNRMHLDVAVVDPEAELTRLVGLGARLLRRAEGYLVLADPEGNQFCLVAARSP